MRPQQGPTGSVNEGEEEAFKSYSGGKRKRAGRKELAGILTQGFLAFLASFHFMPQRPGIVFISITEL